MSGTFWFAITILTVYKKLPMTLNLGDFDIMSYLWDTMEKTEDGKHLRYSFQDLDVLWNMGFVDTLRVSPEIWVQAFDTYIQADGTYLLSKADFLSLDQYRYKGEIKIPFDAMKINEGKYTDEGLTELFILGITPSCDFTPLQLDQFLEKTKKDFRTPDGLIRINQQAKQRIKILLEQHPSPLRNLELLFDHLVSERIDPSSKAQEVGKKFAEIKTEREKSKFSAQAITKTEAKAKELQHLTKARQKTSPASDKPTTELKKIRRSPKGVRG